MKRDLTQLNKVEAYLIANGIPYERHDNDDVPYGPSSPYTLIEFESHQICVPSSSPSNREWDVICNRGSYGAEEGLLEIFGKIVPDTVGDSVEGFLTAEDVIKRIEVWMKEKNNGQKT